MTDFCSKIGRPLPILMYHHIGIPPAHVKIKGLYTTPRQMEWQIQWLLKLGFNFIDFRQLAEEHDSGVQKTSNPIVLTFDDGFLDNFEQALPILRKYEIPAVIFPVVGDLGKRGVVWSESAEQSPGDLIDVDQLRAMNRAGIEIGSHAMDHVHLDRQPPASSHKQLLQSKKTLEDILDTEVLSVAYPYGAYNEQVIEGARGAGYRFGVTTEKGTNENTTDELKLERIPVKGTRWHHHWKFRKQMKTLRG